MNKDKTLLPWSYIIYNDGWYELERVNLNHHLIIRIISYIKDLRKTSQNNISVGDKIYKCYCLVSNRIWWYKHSVATKEYYSLKEAKQDVDDVLIQNGYKILSKKLISML